MKLQLALIFLLKTHKADADIDCDVYDPDNFFATFDLTLNWIQLNLGNDLFEG